MPVLTHLQSRLPERRGGEPLDEEEVIVLLKIDWDGVEEFDEIDEEALDELREETLVRWLIEHWGEVSDTMSEVTAGGGLDPRLTRTVAPSSETRRVADILAQDEYDAARDAYFAAAEQFGEGNFLAARNGARKAAETCRELLSQARSDRKKWSEDISDSEAIERHLSALVDAADALVDACEAARAGRDRVAVERYRRSREHRETASEQIPELYDELR